MSKTAIDQLVEQPAFHRSTGNRYTLQNDGLAERHMQCAIEHHQRPRTGGHDGLGKQTSLHDGRGRSFRSVISMNVMTTPSMDWSSVRYGNICRRYWRPFVDSSSRAIDEGFAEGHGNLRAAGHSKNCERCRQSACPTSGGRK